MIIIFFRYLQWGSYPIITERNATFPPHVVYDRNHTFSMSTWTTFEPKVVTVIPVYSPLPGDWFVGAYLSHWDEKVQQQVNILSIFIIYQLSC